jgi:seryl-tRNA synthetase
MLDIELFRNNLEEIKESEKKRFKDPSNAQKVLDYDIKWREVLQEIEDLRMRRNEISTKIGKLRKDGANKEAEEAIAQSKELREKIEQLEKERVEFYEQREKFRYTVGNILHESVPVGEDEDLNDVVRVVGDKPNFTYKPLSHVDLIEKIDGADTKKASEVVGSRFYYLKGDEFSASTLCLR